MKISVSTLNDVDKLEVLINSAYRGEDSKKGWTTEANLLEGKRIDAEGVIQLIKEQDAVILKCVDDAGVIVGSVYLKQNNDKMYLGLLTVSPSLQNAGIGKKILKASEDYAIEKNCTAIEMRVITVRHELISWYERHGYYDTGKRIPFPPEQSLSVQLQPIEFIIMEKKL
jgi:ribosomal protein S18 acetylase RimI-like enzyme